MIARERLRGITRKEHPGAIEPRHPYPCGVGIFRHRPPPPEQVEALKIADRTLRELAPIVCERVGYPEQAQQLRGLGPVTTAKEARHASRALRSLDRQLSKAPKTEAGTFFLAAIESTALSLTSAAGDSESAKMKIREAPIRGRSTTG